MVKKDFYCYNEKIIKDTKILLRIAVIQCLAIIILSISCIMYNCTITKLKRDNEAKNAQIERLNKEILQYKEESNENNY